jgi:hypothetical protein
MMKEKSGKGGPIVFISVAILLLYFFWWLLFYSHGVTAGH